MTENRVKFRPTVAVEALLVCMPSMAAGCHHSCIWQYKLVTEFRLAACKCTTGGLAPAVCMQWGQPLGSRLASCTHAVPEA